MAEIQIINIILTFLLVGTTIAYTIITLRIYKIQNLPSVYVKIKLINTPDDWDKSLMKDLDTIPAKMEGLASIDSGKKIIMEIFNKGNSPATNIKIEYIIETYKNKIEFGIDKADIINYYPILYKNPKRIEKIDYIPPGEKYHFDLMFTSNYPLIKIKVKKIGSSYEFVGRKLI